MAETELGFRAAYNAAGADRRIEVYSGKANSSAPTSSFFATTTTTTHPQTRKYLIHIDQPPSRPQRARSPPSRSEYNHVYYHASSTHGGGGGGGMNSYSSSSVKPKSAWCFSDPEAKRRRRVAKYKVYAVEGKVTSSLRKGLRWIKCKCNAIVHGF